MSKRQYNFPSEVRGVKDLEKRKKAFQEYLNYPYSQDSLGLRISAGIPLTEGEIESFVTSLGKGCHAHTKVALRTFAHRVPDVNSYAIFSRVLIDGDRVEYCAGQDNTAEVRNLRDLIRDLI